jgi:hypothetical protein
MADYFLGDEQSVTGTMREAIKLSYDWSHVALEVGYDIGANQIVLRPTISVGTAIQGTCLGDACESNVYLAVIPGVTALAPLGRHSFFSFALRYYLVPGGDVDPADGFMFGVGLGAAL